MQSARRIVSTWVVGVSMLIAGSAAYAWSDCSWHKVGYNKSHFVGNGAWCPSGKFMVQLDFDGGGYGSKDMGNYPIVGQVQCCRPAASSTESAGGSVIRSQEYGLSSSDLAPIWAEIEKIKATMGIK